MHIHAYTFALEAREHRSDNETNLMYYKVGHGHTWTHFAIHPIIINEKENDSAREPSHIASGAQPQLLFIYQLEVVDDDDDDDLKKSVASSTGGLNARFVISAVFNPPLPSHLVQKHPHHITDTYPETYICVWGYLCHIY